MKDDYRMFASLMLSIPYDEVTQCQGEYARKYIAQERLEPYWRDMLPGDWKARLVSDARKRITSRVAWAE